MSDGNQSPRLIIIVGPTGAGKTHLALQIAKSIGGEIISADSMQVYRYMDIGTAKPGPDERKLIPHHLIDIVNPSEDFNAYLYIVHATKVIDVIGDSKPIIVVGGTGLYIKALLGGILTAPGADMSLRNHYLHLKRQFGNGYLFQLLQEKDKLGSQDINPGDTIRIIRALEVWDKTGKSISALQRDHRFEDRRYRYLKLGIEMERETLFERIDQRVEDMIAGGFAEEVQWLLDQGYHEKLKSMQAIGYRHMVNYVQGRQPRRDVIATMKRDTCHYAKRQMTWFSSDKEIKWFNIHECSAIEKCIWEFLR